MRSHFVLLFSCLVLTIESRKIPSSKAYGSLRAAMKSDTFQSKIDTEKFASTLLSRAEFVGGRNLADAEAWDQFGFEMSDFSIKYSGCSMVATYSDSLAGTPYAETVLESRKFVTFRLCPSKSCNKYTVTGCTENYGEYIIDIAEYLSVVSSFYLQKKQRFCNYCLPCNQNAAEQDADTDSSGVDGDGEGDGARRFLEDADAAVDEAVDGETCDESTCTNSVSICAETSNEEDLDVIDFLNCAAVEYDDNTEYYLAPQCSSDKFTVSLGVFSDEQCSMAVSNLTATDVLGFQLDMSIFDTYFSKVCTSCLESDNTYDNGEGDADDSDQISELCESLYSASAKCNVNFTSYTEDSYESSSQAQQEKDVCNFINAVQSGAYNENGNIAIDVNWYFNATNWRSASEYAHQISNARKFAVENLEAWQIALLVVFPFACIVMWVWACFLHSALRRRNIPWKPRRNRNMAADDIARQSSGIVLGRSHSAGPGSTPLI